MKFFEKAKQFDIILGSNSPRRKELMKESGIPFRVLKKSGKEDFPGNISPTEVAVFLSKEKAKAFAEEIKKQNTILITADTIVVCDSEIMNKPGNNAEAEAMLENLSGKTHKVITGVSITTKESQHTFHTETLVKFKILDKEEIQYYINKYKPLDKAGSYGIQEWIGSIGIEMINGSYNNVVGLPVHKVYSIIKDIIMAK